LVVATSVLCAISLGRNKEFQERVLNVVNLFEEILHIYWCSWHWHV